MATTEERVDKLEMRFSTLEQQVATVATKVDMLVIESQQQREDIRRLQERQDAEMKALQEKQNAEMKAMNEKIDTNQKEFTRQLHTNFVQTMIGVAAIMATIGGLIITTLK